MFLTVRRFRPLPARWLGWLLAVACLAWAPAAVAVEGTVVRVTDGDTLWLRSAPGRRPHRVRLQGIDAPELCQDGGKEARRALEALVMGRRVVVRERAVDRYGRRLVQVLLAGKDVADEMVQQGWAWNSDFRGRPGPYAAGERRARANAVGVFAKPGAVAPWQFRQQHGSCVGVPEPAGESPITPASAPVPSPASDRKSR